MGRITYRPSFMILLVLTSLFFSQGCYVKVGEKVVLGKEDTSLPGSPLERGCVLKIERATVWYPPEPDGVLFKNPDGQNEQFNRWVPHGAKVKVGKCYQWKLRLGNPTTLKTPEVNPETVQEINP